MGPQGNDLPSRPRFSWDSRNVPWTDGKGNQEEYANAVKLWKSFHDLLPATNPNKITPALQGIMLQSQLFGRARDLVKKIDPETIQSDTGAAEIVKVVHKRDPLAVVSEVYQDFTTVLGTKRGNSESFKNFESRFDSQVSKFNAHATTTKLPDSLVAFMLLANANVENNQRISVLAAASPKESDFENAATTEQFLESVSYSAIASIIRQCDKSSDPPSATPRPAPIPAVTATIPSRNLRRDGTPKKRLTPQELADLKAKSKCRRCPKWGHWASDHIDQDTLKPGTKSFDGPPCTGFQPTGILRPASKALSFNICTLPRSDLNVTLYSGPLVDDGAPYSGIGYIELSMIAKHVCPDWNATLDPLPDLVSERPFWQYGTGQHVSEARKILGSIFLTAQSEQGNPIHIKHLVIDGSSQWVIGRNVTKLCDIIHQTANVLKLPPDPDTNISDTLKLIDQDFHSYLPWDIFCSKSRKDMPIISTFYCASARIEGQNDSWASIKKIVDKVHKHICGHSNYTDIKLLLERNSLWSSDAEKYLVGILNECSACDTTAMPKPARKVSLSSMSRSFNDVVCIDHLFLDEYKVFHAMCSSTRYSVGSHVPDTNMENSIACLEAHWISQFWPPNEILYDPAFENSLFKSYVELYDIATRPIPPRRHNKNVIESKHRIIRDIFLRLKVSNEELSVPSKIPILIQQAIRISNDLYGNDTMSSTELAKGYSRPIRTGDKPVLVPEEIRTAHEVLIAKRKLNLILRSKSTSDIDVSPGDLVEVYLKKQHEKRGKWSSAKPVLSFDRSSRTVTVPGSNGRKIKAAIEDTRFAPKENQLASAIQESIDEIDLYIQEALSDIEADTLTGSEADNNILKATTPEEADDIFEQSLPDSNLLHVGSNIEIYWPIDQTFYPGVVHDISEDKHQINYLDGDTEILDLTDEVWRIIPEVPVISGNQVTIVNELSSLEADAIQIYFSVFKFKEFLQSHAQGLPQFIIQNAYEKEETSFKKTVRSIHCSKVPQFSNVISSHVLYKVKKMDDGSMKMKARIAPHGNKDKFKNDVKKDSATCPPVGIRIALSIASMLKWDTAKIDFTSAFLQAGDATRDVYVIPPRESSDKMFRWLLLTAAYGLVNAGAKWQEHIDSFLLQIGFIHVIFIPQLFYMDDSDGKVKIMAVKVVDDILFAGPCDTIKKVVQEIKSKYELGTVVYGPGNFLFSGLTVTHNEDYTFTIHADEKINACEPYPLDRTRRKQIDENANPVELSAYRSINGIIGWIGAAASPFCSFASSYLQQRLPNVKVRDIITQINMLRQLKRLGSVIQYKRPTDSEKYEVSILIFADANRGKESGQLGFVAGLLIGDFKSGSIFHTLSWISQKSKRPVRSVGVAETFAAGIAIDEGKLLKHTYERILGMQVGLYVAVDSNDLWETISTCRTPTDNAIRSDVCLIRYEFETKARDRLIWIPGQSNLTDPLTKPNSPLCNALQLLMFHCEISFEFPKAKHRISDQSTG